jgi:hypothetical protein
VDFYVVHVTLEMPSYMENGKTTEKVYITAVPEFVASLHSNM